MRLAQGGQFLSFEGSDCGNVPRRLEDRNAFLQERAVPSGVLRSKRELYNKDERMTSSREKLKIIGIPTNKVMKNVLIEKVCNSDF